MVFTKVKIPNEYTKSPIKNKHLMGISVFFIFLLYSYKRLLDSNKMNSSNKAQYCAFSIKKK